MLIKIRPSKILLFFKRHFLIRPFDNLMDQHVECHPSCILVKYKES